MSDDPVTYIIKRRVKVSHQAEFEEWLLGINRTALTFRGHLGTNVIRPNDPTTQDYVIIWRFDSYASLRRWEESPVRQEWLDRSWHMTEGSPGIQKLSGLEFWFTAPPGARPVGPPPRYKMAIVVALALYPLVLALHLVLGSWIAFLPHVLQTLITVIIAVLIMTFVLMPVMTRLLARWLYP